jgi:hypothetical protein
MLRTNLLQKFETHDIRRSPQDTMYCNFENILFRMLELCCTRELVTWKSRHDVLEF